MSWMSSDGVVAIRFYKVRERCEDTGLLSCDPADPAELTSFFASALSWA